MLLAPRYGRLFLVVIGCWLSSFYSAAVEFVDVPLEMPEAPLMDPRPTLPEITHRVYFTIQIDDRQVGRIVFGLFGNVAPRAVENFVALARCDRGVDPRSGRPLCYQGSPLHRIVPGFGISGGDIVYGNGTGSASIYGHAFDDESRVEGAARHTRVGLLSSANRGTRDSNGSQFFIQLGKTPWLDGKHVVFGMILEGMIVAREVERRGSTSGQPLSNVTIMACGESPLLPTRDQAPHYVTDWKV